MQRSTRLDDNMQKKKQIKQTINLRYSEAAQPSFTAASEG
uniref:Uncharacterized protein n=1 Tax=Nelumbo nucifera TaxID=4432 RepID=A0A822XF75_NELNU|nr:TPA_asm: hypothetical protein HUJ06_021577 [Nelumbo nucifera]